MCIARYVSHKDYGEYNITSFSIPIPLNSLAISMGWLAKFETLMNQFTVARPPPLRMDSTSATSLLQIQKRSFMSVMTMNSMTLSYKNAKATATPMRTVRMVLSVMREWAMEMYQDVSRVELESRMKTTVSNLKPIHNSLSMVSTVILKRTILCKLVKEIAEPTMIAL